MKYIGIDLSRRLVASLNQDLAEARASAGNPAVMAGEGGGMVGQGCLEAGKRGAGRVTAGRFGDMRWVVGLPTARGRVAGR